MSSRGAFSNLRFVHIHARAQPRKIVAVYGVDHFIEAGLKRLTVGGIVCGSLQQQVDSRVEFSTRQFGVVRLVGFLAAPESLVGAHHQQVALGRRNR